MGRGDRKTKKGKRSIRSYGNVRPHKAAGITPGAVDHSNSADTGHLEHFGRGKSSISTTFVSLSQIPSILGLTLQSIFYIISRACVSTDAH